MRRLVLDGAWDEIEAAIDRCAHAGGSGVPEEMRDSKDALRKLIAAAKTGKET